MVKSSDILAILVASLAYFAVGFVLYGLLFGDFWLRHTLVLYSDLGAERAAGMSIGQLREYWGGTFPEASGVLPMVFGYLSNVVVAIGLRVFLSRLGVRTVAGYVGYAALVCVCFVIPVQLISYVYSPVSDPRALIDVLHVVLGFAACGAVVGIARVRAGVADSAG